MTDEPKFTITHITIGTDAESTVCPMCVEGKHAIGHTIADQIDAEQHDKGDCKALRLDEQGDQVRCSCTWRPVLN